MTEPKGKADMKEFEEWLEKEAPYYLNNIGGRAVAKKAFQAGKASRELKLPELKDFIAFAFDEGTITSKSGNACYKWFCDEIKQLNPQLLTSTNSSQISSNEEPT